MYTFVRNNTKMKKFLLLTDYLFESRWFKGVTFLFFIVIIAWLKWNHVFERDESQVLLIVNYNRNFFDLISALAYEGSTGLWHVLLWIFSFIIPITPFSAGLIHFILIVTFIGLLFYKIKVPFIFKILFLLQLFVLFNFIYVRQYIFILLFGVLLVKAIVNKKEYRRVYIDFTFDAGSCYCNSARIFIIVFIYGIEIY